MIFKYSVYTIFPTKYDIRAKNAARIIQGPVARPSNPSVRFTALEELVITMEVKII